jgi:tetratricopeptide (TPR) repeat protein
VVKKGLESRRPNKYLLDLSAQIATEVGDFEAAGDYLDELSRLREDGDFHHRMAALLAARGEFTEALRHSEMANRGTRIRFEVSAMLVNIVIELNELERADKLLMELDTRFAYGPDRNHDVRCHLRIKRLLRDGRWADAERTLEIVRDKDSQYYWVNRAVLLRCKIADVKLSPGGRAEAREELAVIERDKVREVKPLWGFDLTRDDEADG